MTRRIPIVATLVVLVAVGIMIRLGFWQLERLHQKEAMLAHYAAAQADQAVRPWSGAGPAPAGYSRVQIACRPAAAPAAEAGRNAQGQAGWVQVAGCAMPGGASARVVLGWSLRPAPVSWAGGTVTGTSLPRPNGLVVVADPPLAGLAPNARPDPRDLPNNHLSYAVQWFAFAGVALVIYALALRKRLGS